MSNPILPPSAIPAGIIPSAVRLQVVSPSADVPDGEDWLHEIKHDGHRLVAIVKPDTLKLISRNGYDRTALFREPFRPLAGLPAVVLDGEIAVPDDRGVTHIDALTEALAGRRPDRLAYFVFDLLHFDGHDLRRCPIEDRKTLLRDVIGAAKCERIVYVDHVRGAGRQLFDAVRQVGGEGIVSKRRGSIYHGRESRDWLKTKCHQTGRFLITGFEELGPGRLEAIYVGEEIGGELVPAGQIRFGFAGKGLWHELDALWLGPARRRIVPISPTLRAEIKFFGRYKAGWIRDGVILSLQGEVSAPTASSAWSCDCDEVMAAFDDLSP